MSAQAVLIAVVTALAVLAAVAGAHLVPLVAAAEITVIIALGGAIARVVAQTGWRVVPARKVRPAW